VADHGVVAGNEHGFEVASAGLEQAATSRFFFDQYFATLSEEGEVAGAGAGADESDELIEPFAGDVVRT
jgi:hypothetical protein